MILVIKYDLSYNNYKYKRGHEVNIMPVVSAIMVPHPPLIVPEVGRGEERQISAAIAAYNTAAKFLKDSQPETIVLTTPHSLFYSDRFHISPGESAKGSFASFLAPSVRITVDYDTEFVDALKKEAAKVGLPIDTSPERDPTLDHGAMVPLYFIQKAYRLGKLPAVVRIGLSGLPLTEHYRLGMLISEVADRLGRRVGFVASGDLSHRLREDGPYGYTPEGPQYDDRIMNVMGEANFGELFEFGEAFCYAAGECGHRSFTIMAGALDRRAVKAERLSYEGPFGVGYGVCIFEPGAADPSRCYLECTANTPTARSSNDSGDPYVKLAKLTVETYVREGKRAKVPDGLPEELTGRRAGVFVSLHIRGRLRGCIGTIEPTTPSVAEEIIQNGISACSRDPRFEPVSPEELPLLEYSVDVLSEPERIDSPSLLDPKRYGIIVEYGFRRGLLLPDLEGVDTVEEQIDIARRKAGIGKNEPYTLYRFEVVRHV